MGIWNIFSTKRLTPFSKLQLLSFRFKQYINKKLGIKLNITDEEQFAVTCFHHLVEFDGVLLQNINGYILSRYNLNGLGKSVLAIRKPPSSDFEVFNQVFEAKEYSPLVDFVLSFCSDKEIKRIVDAGANVGYTTVFFKKHFSEASVISVEPEETNFHQLQKNILSNGLNDVRPVQAGLWKCEEKLEVSSDFRDQKEWSFRLIESQSPNAIKGYTVRDIMKMQGWENIDILKIDIEGAERYLFENKETAGAFLPFVKFISIEIHDEYEIREMIYTLLEEYNFQFFNQGELTIGVNKSSFNLVS